MSRKSSAVFALVAVAGAAGILAAAGTGSHYRTALPAPVPARTPPSVPAEEAALLPTGAFRISDRALRIWANTMITLSVLGIAAAAVVPFVARAMPAPNEVIRSHYGINVVDNPGFTGASFLKIGDDHLAYVCNRPTQGDVLESKELKCFLP